MKKRGEKSYTFEKWGGERERCLLLLESRRGTASITIIGFLISPGVTIKRIGGGGRREGRRRTFFFSHRPSLYRVGLTKGRKGEGESNNKAGRETAGCKGIRAKESLLIHPGKGWLEGGGTTLSDHAEKLSAAGRRNRIASEGNRKVDKVVVGRERAEACWKCARSGRELYIARVCTDRAERIKD